MSQMEKQDLYRGVVDKESIIETIIEFRQQVRKTREKLCKEIYTIPDWQNNDVTIDESLERLDCNENNRREMEFLYLSYVLVRPGLFAYLREHGEKIDTPNQIFEQIQLYEQIKLDEHNQMYHHVLYRQIPTSAKRQAKTKIDKPVTVGCFSWLFQRNIKVKPIMG